MRHVIPALVLAAIASLAALPASASWPTGDGVPLLTGGGGTLLRGSAGELWVARTGTGCPSQYWPGMGFAMLRGRMSTDGVPLTTMGLGDTVECADPVDPIHSSTGWYGAFVTDGRGHLFHPRTYSGHGTWYELRDGDAHVSYNIGSGAASGAGYVFAYHSDDYTSFGMNFVPMTVYAFDSSGPRWSRKMESVSSDGLLLAPDESGGVFAVWLEKYPPIPYRLAYVDRTSALRWTAQFSLVIQGVVPDGAGGALVVCTGTASPAIVLHVRADGTFDPAWPAEGIAAFGGLGVARVLDGGSGAMLLQSTSSPPRLQRFTAAGVEPGWPATGLVVTGAPGDMRTVRDDHGGAWVAWTGSLGTIRYRHVFHDGALSGDDSGIALTTASGNRLLTAVLPDSTGGAFLAWNDSNANQVVLGHIAAEPPPQVTVTFPNGGEVLIVPMAETLQWSVASSRPIASTQLAISRDLGATWDTIATDLPDAHSYEWTPTWGTNHTPVPVFSALLRVTATDDTGNSGSDVSDAGWAVYEWIDAVLLREFVAETGDDGVRLHWSFAAGASFDHLALERATTESGPWTAIDAAVTEADGAFASVDRTAEPGRTYWYRLTATSAGAAQVFGPVHATAAAPRAFALTLASANPARGRVAFAVDMPRDARLAIEVLDLQGRRVATLANGAFAAGRHELVWNGDAPTGPARAGLYFLRVTGASRPLVRRVVLER